MTKTQVSSIPEHTHKIQKIASKVVHLGMYVSMSLIALTGLIIGTFYYFGLKKGFIVEFFLEIHGICVLASYFLIGLHLLGAIFHRLKKDGVWNAMVPFWKE
jgi:cytochrome b561